MKSRDEFSAKTKDILGKRVGLLCSNPLCKRPTHGPREEVDKAVNIGVAAHITAASLDGPRFDKSLSTEKRKSIENGIWLCQNCAKLIDSDPRLYSVELLNTWKSEAERFAKQQLESSYSTEFNWQNSLYKQLTTFSRVEFSIPAIPLETGGLEFKELVIEYTRIVFHMIGVAYFDYYKRTGRDNFVFALTLKPEVVDEHLVSWGELITHLTGFAYKFGELARNLTNGKIDDLIAQLDEYPEIPIKRTLALGTFAAYRISRVNPSEIRIDNLNRKASHTFNGSLSTSDLIMYFSYGVNGQIVVFDDQNKKKQVNKNLKLLNETMDGFDLSEIWIDPDNPEKWLVN